MRNFSKKLAVLTMTACAFGLTQTALAGGRVTVIHISDHHPSYLTHGHYDQPHARYGAPYSRHHGYWHDHRFCRDYRQPYKRNFGHYDSHEHGGKTGSGWHAHNDARSSRHTDHRDRHVANTAYAKGYRY
jgi:hypothetical protein